MNTALGQNDLKSSYFRKQLCCELVGTFLLMWVRKIAVTLESGEWAVMKIAFSLGITIAVLIKVFGRISGCHINPAVSLAYFIVGEMKTLRFFCYVVVQFMGAVAAALFYNEYAFALASGEEQEHHSLKPWQRIVLEMILTSMYIMLFRTMANPYHRSKRTLASMATGFAYVACLLSGTGISETTLNPVLHIAVGPKLWSGDWNAGIGSILGGIVGSLIYEYFYMPPVHNHDFPPVFG